MQTVSREVPGDGINIPLRDQPEGSTSVLMMGFYGRGNFGDDLMCTALADNLVGAGYCVTVVSSDPASLRHLSSKGVKTIPRTFRNVIAGLSKTSILCQGGGTNFHDSYQGSYLLRQWLNLTMWATLFWIARAMGVRVIILGAGMGPLRHSVSRWITRMACAACAAIGVRDQASVEELKKLGTKTYFELGFDLAALSDPCPVQPTAVEDAVKVLGVSACSLTPFLGDAGLNRAYWETMGDALAAFAQSNPVRIVFFSLFTGTSSESDDAIIDLIVSRLPREVSFERHSYQGDVESYGKLFGQCDWFLGAKYHAVLSAYLAGCACAVISYNRKMTDLAQEIRLPLERRVSADKIQQLRKWLSVLDSLTQRERSGAMLGRSAARRRAIENVERILARVSHRGCPVAGVEHGR